MKQYFYLFFFISIQQVCVGQSLFYKDFVELSQNIHPLLVHLKGNIKKIEDSQKGTFYFENKKLVSDNRYCYHYDKDGYLLKATYCLNKYDSLRNIDFQPNFKEIFFIKDSITKKLIKIRSNNEDIELVYNNDSIEYYFSNHKPIPYYGETINKQGQVIASYIVSNHDFITYDENGHIKYIKSYNLMGSTCAFISYIDKYLNEMYYGCNCFEPIVIYNDFDKYGNWQFCTSKEDMRLNMQHKTLKSLVDMFFTITRKYEYYED